MIVYKVRHIPTGLFYQPVTARWSAEKTSLSVDGKVYTKKNYPKTHTNTPVSKKQSETLGLTTEKYRTGGEYILSSPTDWEVVEYELIEKIK